MVASFRGASKLGPHKDLASSGHPPSPDVRMEVRQSFSPPPFLLPPCLMSPLCCSPCTISQIGQAGTKAKGLGLDKCQ